MRPATRNAFTKPTRATVLTAIIMLALITGATIATAQRATTEPIVRIDAPFDDAVIPPGLDVDIVATIANDTGAAVPLEALRFLWNGENRTTNTTYIGTTLLYRAGAQLAAGTYTVRIEATVDGVEMSDQITFRIEARDIPAPGIASLVVGALVGLGAARTTRQARG